ncbi:SOH1-domain-containing protein [Cladorrhinum sp. PSN259]|nr:SOH1-domain-containing protein [Cladorrhinum sp. PSN259]
MASNPMSGDTSTQEPPSIPETTSQQEPKYGGHLRFELELEFVQALSNPEYVMYLASNKLLTNPAFVAYLDYLQYWSRPPYLKYLTFPTASLKMLQLLQVERFREDIINPGLAHTLIMEGMKASVEWHHEG